MANIVTKIAKQGDRERTGLQVILDNMAEKASWRTYIQLVLNKGLVETGRKALGIQTMNNTTDEDSPFSIKKMTFLSASRNSDPSLS